MSPAPHLVGLASTLLLLLALLVATWSATGLLQLALFRHV
jgi:hypothetical protein